MTIQEQIKKAKEELANLQAKVTQMRFKEKLTVKIGEKGTLNVYGMGRYPTCLYSNQVTKLSELFASPEFQQFVAENKDKLAVKEKAV